MTIRMRLAALFTLTVLVLVAGATLLFIDRLRTGLEHGLNNTLVSRADTIAGDLGTATVIPPAVFSEIRLPPANGIYAQVLSSSGTVLAQTHGLTGPMVTPADVQRALHAAVSRNAQIPVRTPVRVESEPMRVLVQPSGHGDVVIAVAISRDVVDEAVSRSMQQLLVLGGVALVLAGPIAWLLARAALRPVELMRRKVAAMRTDQIAGGVGVPRGRDEVSRLGVTFNGLLARLQEARAREIAFVADAGHELRTPLAVLKGELELARRPGRTAEELRDTIMVASEETDRLVRLAEDLLQLAASDSSPALRPVRFDLAAIAADAVRATVAPAMRAAVTVRLDAPGPISVLAEPGPIRRSLDNLLANAIRFTPAGGTVQVSASRTETDAVITVHDDGPGFPKAFLPIAFERFTRADDPSGLNGKAAHGNGLGLAIVRSVMTAHGGFASAENDAGGGAVITLCWPADGIDPAPPAAG